MLALLGALWLGALVLEKLVVAEWAVVVTSRPACELWVVDVSFDRLLVWG